MTIDSGYGYLPDVFQRFKAQYDEINELYENLALKCHQTGPLDEKTRRLVKLGIAIGCGSEGGIRSHARRALEMGLTRDEVNHVILLALTTIGFPAMIAAKGWIDEIPDKDS
ncbi:MAG: carboxymuconolactone decarboxylase family protein [Chloroflexi bacterium]|nr:carboxymuconolactone decarboxylase family protein [Chloroflexota bacterium]